MGTEGESQMTGFFVLLPSLCFPRQGEATKHTSFSPPLLSHRSSSARCRTLRRNSRRRPSRASSRVLDATGFGRGFRFANRKSLLLLVPPPPAKKLPLELAREDETGDDCVWRAADSRLFPARSASIESLLARWKVLREAVGEEARNGRWPSCWWRWLWWRWCCGRDGDVCGEGVLDTARIGDEVNGEETAGR